MLLFINIFVTNQRKNKLLLDDRLDIFKYQLASLSVIPWEKAIIYCRLDNEYEARTSELRNWINELFTDCPVEFYPYRNLLQSEWRSACEKTFGQTSDGLIWMLTNDDHIFIDNSLSVIQEGVDHLKQEQGHASLYYSHWPESMRWFAGQKAEKKGRYVVANRDVTDGIQIVNESLLKTWWFKFDYGDVIFRRTDDIMTRGFHQYRTSRCYLPLTEIVYHMEGYMHVALPYSVFPVWRIPPGFFDKQIKIAYCPIKKKDSWVNIDPRKPFSETDYRMTIDKIPLFWRSRIATIEQNEQIDEKFLKDHRSLYIRDMLSRRPVSGWATQSDAVPPEDWIAVSS